MGYLGFWLAQVNVARMRAALDDPAMRGFADNLEPINRLADASPGFVWRLRDEGGAATSIRIFDDEMILVNLSVWESVESLRAYVYGGRHADFLRRRKDWFERFDGAYYALWWVRPGHLPSVAEAREKLERLRAEGDSRHAFSFKRPFPPPEGDGQMAFPLALESPPGPVTVVDAPLIDRAVAMSRRSPRGRIILPLHPDPSDSLHRMLNALQPGSYVRPHRHANPPKAESLVVLQGAIRYVTFDEHGRMQRRIDLAADSAQRGIDTRPGVFHTFFALCEDTVLFEVKPGPYAAAADKDFAAWAPAEGSPEAASYLERLTGR